MKKKTCSSTVLANIPAITSGTSLESRLTERTRVRLRTRPHRSTFTVCFPETRMELAFYVAAAVAIISTGLMLRDVNVVHALLYLIVSLLAVAVVFYVIGAPFVAALEVIIYADRKSTRLNSSHLGI